ncbi:MAG: TPM domain-containing protein [Candidatus Margulisiibacteriota bacterium]
MLKKLWLIVVLGLSLSAAGWSEEVKFPAAVGFVNDFAGVLDQGTAEKLRHLSSDLEKKTSAELAIVTVKTVAPLDPKEYAVKLFEKWGVGKKGQDNGLLFLVAVADHRVEIEVGYGLEGVITDARAGRILDEYVVPRFKEGDYSGGIYNGAAALAERIATEKKVELGGDYKAEKPTASGGEAGFFSDFWLIVGIIGLIFLSVIFSGKIPGLLGLAFGAFFGFSIAGLIGAIVGAIIGFVLSFFAGPFSGGGGFGGGFGGGSSWGGGGFSGGGGGGFGGGGSGGGGSGRSW